MRNEKIGRVGVALAFMAIVLAGIAIIFVNVDDTITGPAIVPTVAALYALLTGGWAVYLAHTDADIASAKSMLMHMTRIGVVAVLAIGAVAWLRATESTPAALATLVSLQAPLAVFLGKRYISGTF